MEADNYVGILTTFGQFLQLFLNRRIGDEDINNVQRSVLAIFTADTARPAPLVPLSTLSYGQKGY